MTALIFTSSRITPKLVARIGARPILLFGLVAIGVATLWISKATPTQGYLESLFGPLALFGGRRRFVLLAAQRDDPLRRAASRLGGRLGHVQTMQQTGGALGVAALSSIAAAHGSSDALRVGAGIIAVALLVAYVAIRPTRPNVPATAEEAAQEMIPLLLSE